MTDALRIANNLAETMSHFGRTEASATVCELDGIRIVDVGVTLPVFNTAVLTAPVNNEAELRSRLTAAQSQFAAHATSWSFWTCGGLMPPDLERAVPRITRDFGLTRNSATPGMIAKAVSPGPPVDGLEIRRIADAASRTSFCRILSQVFAGPTDQLTEMYAREQLWTGEFRGYLGSIGGRDVCAGFAVVAAGALGIYGLATLPAFARRGCASALIRHAFAESRVVDGETPLVLQSTELGMRLYRRLGFRAITDCTLYCAL